MKLSILFIALNLCFLALGAYQEQVFLAENRPQFLSINQGENTISLQDNELFSSEEDFELKNSRSLASKPQTIGEVMSSVESSDSNLIVLAHNEKFTVVAPFYVDQPIQIIDVSSLAAPRIASSIPREAKIAKGLYLSADDKTLVVADFENIRIYNVTNIYAPVLLGSTTIERKWPYEYAREKYISFMVSADGKTAYMGNHGLDIYDISNPASITRHAYLPDLDCFTLYIMADGKTLLTGGEKYLSLFDVSNPKTPVLLQQVTFQEKPEDDDYFTPGKITSITVSANQKDVYIAFVMVEGRNTITDLHRYQLIDKKTLSKTKEIGSLFGRCYRAIISLSIGETYAFVVGDFALMAVNLETGNEYYILADSLYQPTSVAVSADGRYGYFTVRGQMSIAKLFLDLQLGKIFNLNPVPIGSVKVEKSPVLIAITPDGKTLFVNNELYRGAEDTEVVSIADPRNPTVIKKFHSGDAERIKISSDGLLFIVQQREAIVIFSTSDYHEFAKLEIKEAKYYFGDIAISSNGKKLYVIQNNENEPYFTTFDLSNPSEPKNLTAVNLEAFRKRGDITFKLSKKDDFAFFMSNGQDKDIKIVNIADPAKPVILSSIMASHEGKNIDFSADEKLAYIISQKQETWFFTIVDISNLTSPKIISQIFLPGSEKDVQTAMSTDGNTLFITTRFGFMALDISLINNPILTAVLYPDEEVVSLKALNDGKTVIFGTLEWKIHLVDISAQTAGFLSKRKYGLGGTYSSGLEALQVNFHKRFDAFPENYVYTKMYHYKAVILPSSLDPKPVSSSLPAWMNFDKTNGILTLEPKAQATLGSYNLRGVVSTAVKKDAFIGVTNITDENESLELIIHLIGLGYMNRERFLTAEFEPNTPLLLAPHYQAVEESVRKNLTKHYFEFSNTITIEPSLTFSKSKILKVATLFTHSVSVNIILNPEDNSTTPNAQFMSITYPGVLSTVTHSKTRITLDGDLDEINNALSLLAINLHKDDSYCDGLVTISDGANPVITESIHNISSLLHMNQKPKENSKFTLQDQIDERPIKTGEHFQLELSADSFIDANPERLQYSLRMPNPHTPLPVWINQRGLIITGTAPEKIMLSEVKLIFVAKNEFKEVEIPITINIKLSFVFILQTLAKYGSYIFSAIGLYVLLTKIYNILGLKYYRHPKTFLLFPGQEVSSSCIYPISFIAEEAKISNLIQQKLRDDIGGELRKAKITDAEYVDYFVNPSNNTLDKEKIVRMTNAVLSGLDFENKQNLKYYASRVNLYRDQICELTYCSIVNKSLELPREKSTKALLKSLKADWNELIEFNKSSKFVIREKKFENKLLSMGKNINPSGGQLLPKSDFNLDLLKHGLVAYAHRFHNLNFRIHDVDINVMEQTNQASALVKLTRLLKKDHENIPSNDKGKVGYGIRYEIRQNTLSFVGVPEEDFAGRTAIIQIVTRKGRIIRELCILGCEKNPAIDKVEDNL